MKKLGILLLVLLLTSCSNQEIVDEIQIVNSFGYDYEDGKIKGTILYPLFKYGSTEEPSLISAKAETTFDVPAKLDNKSPLPIADGQLRSLLLGESFAKRGLQNMISTVSRNPNLGRTMQVAISKGSAHEMLSSVTKKKMSDTQYINKLIEQNIKMESFPRTNFQIFLFNFFAEDRDAFLPYLKSEKNAIKLAGIALFRKYQFVDVLSMKHAFIFKLLDNGSKNGRYMIDIKKDQHKGQIALQNLYTKNKYYLKGTKESPEIQIVLKIDGKLQEYPFWINVNDPSNVELISKQLKANIEKEAKDVLDHIQKLDVDPLALKDFIRSRTRHYDHQRIRAIYKDIPVSVRADVTLVQTGINE
ncbi:Ger(x)C family spore germination protein [Priestia koreensis]|uniref:Ger(x)C family spore germination protein n=1 Tax=Priestia koreensis TaxID=284581 RepID=UPI001F55F684|nr:Ger(x)C family spore germination protein [Priestia koreensis]UNL85833.1 Ger(x)C family spore germination protein [Priestia koreensis]